MSPFDVLMSTFETFALSTNTFFPFTRLRSDGPPRVFADFERHELRRGHPALDDVVEEDALEQRLVLAEGRERCLRNLPERGVRGCEDGQPAGAR